MADFDMGLDAQNAIAGSIHDRLAELMQESGNEWNIPGEIQAAHAFAQIVVPAKSVALMVHDDLYTLASSLVELLDEQYARGGGWDYKGGVDLSALVPTIANEIRGWIAVVDASQDRF